MRDLVSAEQVSLLAESSWHPEILLRLLERSRVPGARVHEARSRRSAWGMASTSCGTADSDFGHFPALRTRNPSVPVD